MWAATPETGAARPGKKYKNTFKLKRKLKAAVFAIIAEHRFLACIARANPARYATEAARVAKKHSSSVFSPLGELANGDK